MAKVKLSFQRPPKADAASRPEQPRKEPPLQRLLAEIGRGATVPAAAERAGIRPEIAELMVDYLERSGRLQSATSLCSSGLGACGTGTSDQVKIHCAGCPLSA
ncbi:MAG TPA: hypothetical protein GX000_04360 [Actinomyces sp.]|jgi:hypothetical protein|nr:hypothetical protein [Actinomyces sp.]